MIGRAAQGRPWIFREIEHFLPTRDAPAAAGTVEPKSIACSPRITARPLRLLRRAYRDARRAQAHLLGHTKGLAGSASFRHAMNQLADLRRAD